jgi:tetratricopeptide (TPR) repeat protein
MSVLRARQRDVPEVAERYRDVRLLLTARSQEWAAIQPPFSPTELQDLGLTPGAQVVIGALSPDQCREMVRACVEQWNVEAEDRLLELAGTRAAERDATPLYVLSMLVPARVDGRLRDEHLAHLPPSVLELWQMYWQRLTAVEQGLLRLVKLFAVTSAPPRLDLFNAAAEAFSLSPHEGSRGLDALEAALWISRQGSVPTSLDVQLEAISLHASDLARWDTFVGSVAGHVGTHWQMHNGTGAYHLQVRAAHARTSEERLLGLLAALKHFSAMVQLAGDSDPSLRAQALNNLSVVYSDLADVETTREGWDGWMLKAVEAVEEAVRIRQELGIQGDLAMSLNNAPRYYIALASLETKREGRGSQLQKAVKAVEQAVTIRRRLAVQGDLAASLTVASILYTALADLETTRECRIGWLQKAVDMMEEAVRIYRELGVQEDVAMSLGNSSNLYSALADLGTTRESRSAWLKKSMEVAEEAVRLNRALGLQRNLATALDVASNCYFSRVGVETTREDRGSWLHRAIEAVEEAACIHRELGMQGHLAMSLSNVSNLYSELASLETTCESQGNWLRKAVAVVEESVRIRRALGVQDELAASLNNASQRYSSLAGLETSHETSACWLEKAVEAVEEAVHISREVGMQAELALSLGTSGQVLRKRAENSQDSAASLADLRASCAVIDEAVQLFRESGNMPYLLLAVQELVTAFKLLARAGDTVDGKVVRAVCGEGWELARSMEDKDALSFFQECLDHTR